MIGKPVAREEGGVLSFMNETVRLHSSRTAERTDVQRKCVWRERVAHKCVAGGKRPNPFVTEATTDSRGREGGKFRVSNVHRTVNRRAEPSDKPETGEYSEQSRANPRGAE